MGIEELPCPVCGESVEMGLPQSAVVKSVAAERESDAEDPRVKWRKTACANGHAVFVQFEF